MTTININPVGSGTPVEVDKKDFLGALETCDQVNNIITINGLQYSLNTVEFGGGAVVALAKVYRALLTQTGNSAPTAELINDGEPNYLGDIAWSISYEGVYTGTKAAAFPDGKVFIMAGQNSSGNSVVGFDTLEGDANTVKVITNGIVAGASKLVKLKDDGTIKAGFSRPVITGNIWTAGIEPGWNKIIIGGDFQVVNGTSVGRIARLNFNGTLDTSFNVGGSGFDTYAVGEQIQGDCIAVQSNGKIVVAGSFTSYNGVPENRIIRLNSDGTKDVTFATGTGFNGDVSIIRIDNAGNILVGGSFTSYNGTAASKIVRLTTLGAIDGTFIYGSGFNNTVESIAIDGSGSLVISGRFTTYKGGGANRIIRLDNAGNKDATFLYGTGFDNIVHKVVYDIMTGSILCVGRFDNYNGTAARRIIKLNPNAGLDSTFIYGSGFDGDTYTAEIDSENRVYVSGSFSSYKGITLKTPNVIKLDNSGGFDNSFETSVNAGVYKIITNTSENEVLLFGDFDIAFLTIGTNGILNKTPIEIIVKQP